MNLLFEIQLIEFIQQFNNPVFDLFFKTVTIFGELSFLFIFASIMYWTISKRFALKFVALTLIASALSFLLKDIIQRPRPYDLGIPYQGEMHTTYSMPSGHSQLAASMGFLLWREFCCKKRWVISIIILVMLLVFLSRMYLGHHFLTDLIFGATVGFGISIGFFRLFELVGEYEHLVALLGIPILIGAAYYTQSDHSMVTAAGYSGVTLGYFIDKTWFQSTISHPRKMQTMKIILGLLTTFCIHITLHFALPDNVHFILVHYLALGLWITLGAPYCFKLTLFRLQTDKN